MRVCFSYKSSSAKVSSNADSDAWYGAHNRSSLHQNLQDDDDLRLLRQANVHRYRTQMQGVQVQVPQGLRIQSTAFVRPPSGTVRRVQTDFAGRQWVFQSLAYSFELLLEVTVASIVSGMANVSPILSKPSITSPNHHNLNLLASLNRKRSHPHSTMNIAFQVGSVIIIYTLGTIGHSIRCTVVSLRNC